MNRQLKRLSNHRHHCRSEQPPMPHRWCRVNLRWLTPSLSWGWRF